MNCVDFRRLELLVALSRLGSMRAVAQAHGLSTSTVSQQLAALSREVGVALTEPAGRRVRLTSAGRHLVGHAVSILAAVEAARRDLDPAGEPVGTVRVGGFSTGIRVSLLPILTDLAATTPALNVVVSEYAPGDSIALLVEDELDLVLTYDFALSPAILPAGLEATPIWLTTWGLGVAGDVGAQAADLSAFGDRPWIVNSGSVADENVVRALAAIYGFIPRIGHQIQSLELVEELVSAKQGVALLPMKRPVRQGVEVLAIEDPTVTFTAYAVWRRGRTTWAPLRVVIERLLPRTPTVPRLEQWPDRA
jgi:DNA-binding transcriptional LysR family regulator